MQKDLQGFLRKSKQGRSDREWNWLLRRGLTMLMLLMIPNESDREAHNHVRFL